MDRTDVVIVGAGQAGLAMSACLVARGIEHVVVDRGRAGERWRTGSWDSLRLLTPNWLSRLPGWRYSGPDPDGYMSKNEVVAFLDGYAASFNPPLVTGADVREVERVSSAYRVVTSRGRWEAAAVVIATGQCESPFVPDLAGSLSPAIHQISAANYRNPDALPAGGVLIVGASASGIQISDELQNAGRPVTLSVGRHTRLPRSYRGRDIMWWLDRLGILDERAMAARDLDRLRRQPSLQLIGRPDRGIDLAYLRESGARIVGRAVDAGAGHMDFAGDLAETTAAAERKLARLIARIDEAVERKGMSFGKAESIAPVVLDCPATRVDFAASDIGTVIWATGYKSRYQWLRVPVLTAQGEIEHDGGVTASPGLYVLGLRWLRRRSSSFIAGSGLDAHELADEIARWLFRRDRIAA